MLIVNDPIDSPPITRKPSAASKKPHYVNNKEFSSAVVAYVNSVHESRRASKPEPKITPYIGSCILKIAEGLSRKFNFIGYSYREDMVLDGVANCVRAIMNYKVEAATRSGTPNAFGYFGLICHNAFLRRIAKEKRQQEIKMRYIDFAGASAFADFEGCEIDGDSMVARVRSKNSLNDEKTDQFPKDPPPPKEPVEKKVKVPKSSSKSLEAFFVQ